MANYQISFDLNAGVQAAIKDVVNKQVFPLVHQAVRAVAFQTSANWKQAVLGAKLWSGEKDAYAKTITWRMTGDFSAVVESNYSKDQEIETGRPQRDLKKMLDTSTKVRRTKDGRRFLVIPMRHNTPGNNAHAPAMPQAVYNLAAGLGASRITGTGTRLSGEVTNLSPKGGMSKAAHQPAFLSNPKTKSAMTVTKFDYQWGSHLTKTILKQAGLNAQERRRYAGMYRFDTSTPGAKSSSFLTFRTMMEGSKGWIVPAQPGLYLAKKVTDDMQPLAKQAFEEAIKRSIG